MITRRPLHFVLLLNLVCGLLQATAAELLKLEPIVWLKGAKGTESLATLAHFQTASKPQFVNTAFLAVVSAQWPEGLVPLFSIEREDGQFELRRLPRRGQESGSEPLFFALPREEETNATRIAGKWNGHAANAQRSNHSPDWQLAIDGERVAGRFDPYGEYRVAFITGGVFRSNRLELNVEYINDHYVLNGEWRDGKLSGTWRQLEEPEKGTWEATRPQSAPKLPTRTAVPLYEWRNPQGQRRYSTNEKMPGWQREAKELCRVWNTK